MGNANTTQYSPEGFLRMLQDMNRILDQCTNMKQTLADMGLEQYRKYDTDGLLQKFCDSWHQHGNDLFTVIQNLKLYEQRLQGEIEEGTAAFNLVEDVRCDISAFGPAVAVAAAATYGAYKSYQLLLNSDYSFSGDFNDIKTFMNSDFYRLKNLTQTGYSMISDWSLWGKVVSGNTDEITNEWLEASLIGMLNSMPEAAPSGFQGVADWAEDATGIKNLDGWIKTLADLAKKYAAAGRSRSEFFASPEVEQLLKSVRSMDEEDLRHYMQLFIDEDTWSRAMGIMAQGEAAEIFERLGDDLDTLEWLDLAFSGLDHALTNHTAQLQYIDTMQQVLEANGNVYGPVYEVLDELRDRYNSSLYNTAVETWDKAKGEAIKAASKGIAGKIPGIREANAILSTGSKTIKLMAGKDISADKALMGMAQYDEVFTHALEGYAQKMQDGMATETDMENAERLYHLLLGTKKKEYESMLQMVGDGAARGVYLDKYNKLLEMEEAIADQAAGSAADIMDKLEQFSNSYHAAGAE